MMTLATGGRRALSHDEGNEKGHSALFALRDVTIMMTLVTKRIRAEVCNELDNV